MHLFALNSGMPKKAACLSTAAAIFATVDGAPPETQAPFRMRTATDARSVAAVSSGGALRTL